MGSGEGRLAWDMAGAVGREGVSGLENHEMAPKLKQGRERRGLLCGLCSARLGDGDWFVASVESLVAVSME